MTCILIPISVQSGYSALSWASSEAILNKISGIPHFSGTEREKDTAQFKQWLHAISTARKSYSEQLVWAAINKSCVGMLLMPFAVCHQGQC